MLSSCGGLPDLTSSILSQEFFLGLHEREKELGITDIQLSLSTLDEVFLKIAKQAELETAAAEGRYELLTLTPKISVQVSL